MSSEEFGNIGELRDAGFIEETTPQRWMPTARGARMTRKFIIAVLAAPNNGTDEETYALFRATEILAALKLAPARDRVCDCNPVPGRGHSPDCRSRRGDGSTELPGEVGAGDGLPAHDSPELIAARQLAADMGVLLGQIKDNTPTLPWAVILEIDGMRSRL